MEAWRVADARRITRGVYTMESRGVCSHDKDGVCSIHGPGAVWKHKPGKKTTTIGPDWRKKFRMTKEYFWLCDIGEGGRRLNYPLGHQMPGGRGEGGTIKGIWAKETLPRGNRLTDTVGWN